MLRAFFTQIKNQGPGLGVGITLVTSAKAMVLEQERQGGAPGDYPPVRQAKVVSTADAGPAATTDHLELGGETLVEPEGEIVVVGRKAA